MRKMLSCAFLFFISLLLKPIMFLLFRIVPDTTPCQSDELMVLRGTYIQVSQVPYPFLLPDGIHPNDYS